MFTQLPFPIEGEQKTLPEGLFLLPVCTTRERLLWILSALGAWEYLARQRGNYLPIMDIWNAMAYLDDPSQSPCVEANCGRTDDCIRIPLYDPRIEWFPNNPFQTPDLIPEGYLLPPWYIQNEFPPSVVGVPAGEVATDLLRITSIAGWHLQYPIPRFRLTLTGAGVVQIYLRKIQQGGFAQIQENGDIATLRYANTNATELPPSEPIVIIEREYNDPDSTNFIDISSFPNVFESPIPVGMGFSVIKILICGFGVTPDCPECPQPDDCCCDDETDDCGCCDDCDDCCCDD